MTDNRFKDFPVDARFPSLGRDVRFEDFPTDKRFTGGLDTRFQGPAYGGGGEIPVITGVPTISGTATVGSVLTASPAPVTGDPTPTRTWQWYRGGVAIGGATSITYTLVLADSGATITVEQIETNTEGFDTAVSAGVAVAFTPASIFAGTDEGFWADVTPSRLWQDVARTTPVTAAGQAVASWELTTRTGVIYAEQATAGSRPIYQLDGLAGYLDFNGSRWMATPTITPTSDKVQLFGGLQNNNLGGATRVILESGADSDLVNGIVLLFYVASIPGDMRFRSRGAISPASNGTATSGTVVPNAAKISVTGLGDIAADSSIVRLNGTQIASAATDQGTGNYGAHQIFIGGRTSVFYQGRIYGLALRFGPNLTAGQITDMEGWMASVLNP